MKNTHRSTQLFGRAALVALLAAPTLSAQGRWEDRDRREGDDRWENDDRRDPRSRDRDGARHLFTWRGGVDDDTRIYIRGGAVQSQIVSGSSTRVRTDVDRDNALPRRDGLVRVQLLDGRGRVHVIQQPSARNNYTAIVRVKDAQGGADRYRFAVYFDPTDRGGVWNDVGGDVGSGYGARALHWAGSVDGDLRIELRGGQVFYDVVSGASPQNVRTSTAGQSMRRQGYLAVAQRQGRGTVSVIQQPSAYNNYTAIVRVLDRPGGYGHYDFDLIWR